MKITIDEAIKRYDGMFEDGFPTIPLLRDLEDNECIKIINKCIEERKDVYEMGYLELSDIEY